MKLFDGCSAGSRQWYVQYNDGRWASQYHQLPNCKQRQQTSGWSLEKPQESSLRPHALDPSGDSRHLRRQRSAQQSDLESTWVYALLALLRVYCTKQLLASLLHTSHCSLSLLTIPHYHRQTPDQQRRAKVGRRVSPSPMLTAEGTKDIRYRAERFAGRNAEAPR